MWDSLQSHPVLFRRVQQRVARWLDERNGETEIVHRAIYATFANDGPRYRPGLICPGVTVKKKRKKEEKAAEIFTRPPRFLEHLVEFNDRRLVGAAESRVASVRVGPFSPSKCGVNSDESLRIPPSAPIRSD